MNNILFHPVLIHEPIGKKELKLSSDMIHRKP